MKRNPLPMREQLNRVVPSGSAEDGARGSAPYMGQGTSPLWVGRAKPCPCGALNYFRLAKSNIEFTLGKSNRTFTNTDRAELERPRGLPPRTPAKRSTLDRNSLAVGQREQAFLAPLRE